MPALAAGVAVLAAVAVTVAASRHAATTTGSPLDPRGGWREAWTAAVIAAGVLYLAGLAALRRRAAPLAAVVALAAAIQLAPLAAPLLLSKDAFVYWDYGRIAAVHRGNPYRDLPQRWPADPAYARMGSDWHRTYDAYGPAWTLVSQENATVAGTSPPAAARIFKWVGAVGMLALVAAATFTARRRAYAAAFVGWNPLLALQFGGGGHNDAWMMAFAVAAVALTDDRSRLAGVPWVAGIAVKWLPVLFLPLEAARLRGRFPWRGFAIAAVVAAAISSVFYGPWWVRALVPISNQLRSKNTLGLPYWVAKLGPTVHQAAVVLTVLFALAYVWLLLHAWRGGRRRYALTAGLFCLTLAWLTPWYATWPLAFAAVEEDAAGTALALALGAYLLWDAVPV